MSVSALVRFLIARGELGHREGAWVLPNEPAQVVLPEEVEDAALERLAAEGEAVRALAEALSMHRGAITPELCATVTEEQHETAVTAGTPGLLARLEALVRCEVLALGRSGYRFSSERLREKLSARIDGARRVALHLRMGEALLARGANTPLERLAAGVHLLEAHDPRGLGLATEAAAVFNNRLEGIAGAIRLLERAVVLAREANAPAAQQLTLLAPLGSAAYLVDHRLVRHTKAIADLVDEVVGLRLTRKLIRFGSALGRIGRYIFGHIGFDIAFVRYSLSAQARAAVAVSNGRTPRHRCADRAGRTRGGLSRQSGLRSHRRATRSAACVRPSRFWRFLARYCEIGDLERGSLHANARALASAGACAQEAGRDDRRAAGAAAAVDQRRAIRARCVRELARRPGGSARAPTRSKRAAATCTR